VLRRTGHCIVVRRCPSLQTGTGGEHETFRPPHQVVAKRRRDLSEWFGLGLSGAVIVGGMGSLISQLASTTLRLWRWIVAVTAIALCSGLSLHLTDTFAPLAKRDATLARPDGVVRTAPTPALAALRKNLSRLASRTDVAPGYAEDLAGATAFYDAHSGPLLWVTESGISPRGIWSLLRSAMPTIGAARPRFRLASAARRNHLPRQRPGRD
jgi:hypothetical protein